MSEEILKVLEKLKGKNNYQRDCNDGSYFIELFANEIYILCKFMEDLQQKIERLENIRKEAIEECKSVIGNPEHTIVSKNELMKILLNILNKGSEE